ncbi:MAG: uracil phosphoribosyltransferase [Actinomycetota bacterium]|nr:uracil phosphoribosyltransferase [Actinomycetota bacterium]
MESHAPANGTVTEQLTVIDHPLVADKIARLRDISTDSSRFRSLCQEVTVLTAYEALRDLPTITEQVTTPITTTDATVLAGRSPAVVGILRAGLIMVEAILSLLPEARVGHIGLYRDPTTHLPVEYYCKLPPDLDEREIILVDPMLATGGSAVAAIDRLKAAGATSVRLLSIIGCPEGVAAVYARHGDVAVTLAALDERLNEHAYIVPGLGDAGDRIYGTL